MTRTEGDLKYSDLPVLTPRNRSMKEGEFPIPPDEYSPMSRPWTRLTLLFLAIFLAMVVSMSTGGCTQRQIAGRAPSAPALQPVSSHVYSVRLGSLESPPGIIEPGEEDRELQRGSMTTPSRD